MQDPLSELPNSSCCVFLAVKLVQGGYLPEATDLLFLLYENEIAFSAPQIAQLLNSIDKLESLPEGPLATFLEVSLPVKAWGSFVEGFFWRFVLF